VAKAFVGSNPTPRTIEQLTILCFGVFSISRRGGLVHGSFLVGGRCLAGQGCFLPVFLFWVWIGVFWGWGEALGKPWNTGLVGLSLNRG